MNTSINKNCPYLEDKCKDLQCDCAKYLAYLDAKDEDKVKALMEEYNFDVSLPDWPFIMSMQKSFESRFHSMEHLSKEEMEHWLDRYCICIEDEMAEIRDYLSIFGEPIVSDKSELKKEVIDILHFVMDMYLSVLAKPEEITKAYEKYYNVEIKNDLILDAYKIQTKHINEYLNFSSDDNNDFVLIKAMFKMADALRLIRQQISWKHWKKPSESINFVRLYETFAVLFHEFINLTIITIPKAEDIRGIYVKKNIENIFRQKHNY